MSYTIEPKQFLGASAIAIGGIAYAIYLWRTAKQGGVSPHPFSWLLWGLVTTVAALAQNATGAGPGLWVTAFTAAVCFLIGVLTLLKNRWSFTTFDWLSLIAGLSVLLLYRLATDPTASTVLATITDVLGYNSTIRKGWLAPHTDSATSFALNSVKFIPALFALKTYSIATCLYPATLVLVNGGVAVMLILRRRQLTQTNGPFVGPHRATAHTLVTSPGADERVR
jgi:hypothetical protein